MFGHRMGSRPSHGALHQCPLQCRWWMLPDHRQCPQGARHRRLLQLRWWMLSNPLVATPKGLAINTFFTQGGGHCQTHRQHPPGGPLSMSSSALVVDTVEPTGSAPRGPTIDVFFNLGGGRCRTRHQRLLHPRWALLPDQPTAVPGGLPLMSSSTLVVVTVGPTGSTPRGFGIDVFFILSGGCWQTHQQCAYGVHHRCLIHPRWWLLPDLLAVPQGSHHRRLLQPQWRLLLDPPTCPQGVHDVFLILGGGNYRTHGQHPPGAYH
jgi:hypothetical protein